MPDEHSPLLQFPGTLSHSWDDDVRDLYPQFCHLVGIKPVDFPPGQKFTPNPEALYQRATHHRRNQNATYLFSATMTNGMLLSQIVLGAALTGLGASDSSRVLITVFGAFNTVIAGAIAFVKSRGQPMRARMFRDDLERVVDEIENSAVMWLGISRGAHGYDAIDIDDQVTIRSEVARLTRLYDRAVKTNTMNDPDMYSAHNPNDGYSAATRARGPVAPAPLAPAPSDDAAAGKAVPPPDIASTPAPVVLDPDQSPATIAPVAKAPEPAEVDAAPEQEPKDKKDESSTPTPPSAGVAAPTSSASPVAKDSEPIKVDDKPQAPIPSAPAVVVHDPDESPATAVFHKDSTKTSAKNRKDSGEPTSLAKTKSVVGKENEEPVSSSVETK